MRYGINLWKKPDFRVEYAKAFCVSLLRMPASKLHAKAYPQNRLFQ